MKDQGVMFARPEAAIITEAMLNHQGNVAQSLKYGA